MKNFVSALLLLAAVAVHAGPSIIPANLDVDFRTWAGANNQLTFTLGSVTANALPVGLKLYQDITDGLGVRSGEVDEIENEENLEIVFSGGKYLTGVWITDLFDAPDGVTGETGVVSLYGLSGLIGSYLFDGNLSDQNNGEIYVPFAGSSSVYSAVFNADIRKNNEFSVAGFTASTPPPSIVPTPGALVLGSVGMGVLGTLRRRRSL